MNCGRKGWKKKFVGISTGTGLLERCRIPNLFNGKPILAREVRKFIGKNSKDSIWWRTASTTSLLQLVSRDSTADYRQVSGPRHQINQSSVLEVERDKEDAEREIEVPWHLEMNEDFR